MSTFIIGTLVLGAFVCVGYKTYKDKKSGKGCGGSCSGCQSSCKLPDKLK